jgi:hypothetical protein
MARDDDYFTLAFFPMSGLDQDIAAGNVAMAVHVMDNILPLVAVGDPDTLALRARDRFHPDAVIDGAIDRLNPDAFLDDARWGGME